MCCYCFFLFRCTGSEWPHVLTSCCPSPLTANIFASPAPCLQKTITKLNYRSYFFDLKSNSALLYNKGHNFWKSVLTWKILQTENFPPKRIISLSSRTFIYRKLSFKEIKITAPPNEWCNIPLYQSLWFLSRPKFLAIEFKIAHYCLM